MFVAMFEGKWQAVRLQSYLNFQNDLNSAQDNLNNALGSQSPFAVKLVFDPSNIIGLAVEGTSDDFMIPLQDNGSLLDWTISPYIAAFFAVNNVPVIYPSSVDNGFNEKSFAIFALHKHSTLEKNKKLNLSEEMSLKVIDPLFDGNPRLVSQGGLFTKIPVSSDV